MTTVLEITISVVGLFLGIFCWGMVNVFTRKAVAMESASIALTADKPAGPDPAYIAELEADCAVPMEQVIREAEALAEVQTTPTPVRTDWTHSRLAFAVWAPVVSNPWKDCELDFPEGPITYDR